MTQPYTHDQLKSLLTGEPEERQIEIMAEQIKRGGQIPASILLKCTSANTITEAGALVQRAINLNPAKAY